MKIWQFENLKMKKRKGNLEEQIENGAVAGLFCISQNENLTIWKLKNGADWKWCSSWTILHLPIWKFDNLKIKKMEKIENGALAGTILHSKIQNWNPQNRFVKEENFTN